MLAIKIGPYLGPILVSNVVFRRGLISLSKEKGPRRTGGGSFWSCATRALTFGFSTRRHVVALERRLGGVFSGLGLPRSLAPARAQLPDSTVSAFLPRMVTAAMQTAAIRATRRAYSTSEAPRSLLPKRTWSQVLRNS